MKKNNKKGFTLAELLIVVAIIAVLTAIAIPVFTSQLERSRESTDMANVRSAYAGIVAHYLETGTLPAQATSVAAQQTVTGWQTSDGGGIETISDGGTSRYSYAAQIKPASYAVTITSTASGDVIPSVTAAGGGATGG